MRIYIYIHAFVTQEIPIARGASLTMPTQKYKRMLFDSGRQKPLAAQSVSSVAALAGDRIVFEIGYRARNTLSSSRTGTLWHGEQFPTLRAVEILRATLVISISQ